MSVKYFAQNWNQKLRTKFNACNLDVYISKRRKYVHIGFDEALLLTDRHTDIISEIIEQWGPYGKNSLFRFVKFWSYHG